MLQKSSEERTAEVFFLMPTREHYLIDISRKISLAHTSVKKNLDALVKAGIIKKTAQKKGTRIFPVFKANNESRIFKACKQLFNLSSLFESGLIERIEDALAPKSIVLFGSYLRGEDREDSDIDIFIECDEQELDKSIFEKKLGRKIQLHFNKNFKSYPIELKNNISNGLVVSGFLEGYK